MKLLNRICVLTIASTMMLSAATAVTFAHEDAPTSGMNQTVMSAKCTQAINMYMNKQKKATIGNKKVRNNNTISVDYIGRLSDGTVFDTNIRKIAKACDIFDKDRAYGRTLDFKVGVGQMIVGFDAGVVGIKLHETKTIVIPPSQAYGEEFITLPLDQLPLKVDGTEYKQGDSIATMHGEVIIQSITDTEFTINNIHPLAGKELIFDVTVKKISK